MASVAVITTRKPRIIAKNAAYIKVRAILPKKDPIRSKEAGINSFKGLI
jgi:hypothetical protein